MNFGSIPLVLASAFKRNHVHQVMTICTIDVHSRDTVSKMIQQKVETIAAFSWQSQLRHRSQN